MITVTLEESERQAVLLALAKLSVERPGWDDFLNRIALKMDTFNENGRATLYDRIRKIDWNTAWHKILDGIV